MAGGVKKQVKRVKKLKLELLSFAKDIKTNPKKQRVAWMMLLAGLALLLVHPNNLRADTQGANNPTTAVNDTGIGTVAWTGPGNVLSSNDTRATVSLSGNNPQSNYIKATGFGFSIPANSTINGIVAGVERSEGNTNANNFCQDNAVRIVKGGAIGTTDKSIAGDWTTTDAYGTYGTSSELWGNTWTVSDINSANFGLAFSAKNRRAGGSGANTESCRVDHIRITIHYTPPPTTYDQSAYRWFNNANSTNVGSTLANQDTVATAPVKDTPFRLRMTLDVGTTALAQNGETFKLQFAKKGGGSCSSPGDSYADVTTSTAIRYYDNAAASDGATLTTNANDPQHSTHTNRAQTYEENNTFTNSVAAVAVGEDGLWDFALVDSSADYNAAYCFRAVKNTGSTALDTYSVYPEITTAAAPTIDQSTYRIFEHQAANQGFDSDGIATSESDSDISFDVAIDSTYMYMTGRDSVGGFSHWRTEKRALSTSALDNGFGTSGVVTGITDSANRLAIAGSYVYLTGRDSSNSYAWRIEKRALSNGALDNGFGSSGVVIGAAQLGTVEGIATDASYMYIVGTNDVGNGWRIEKRALSNGALDNGFGSSGVVTGASADNDAFGIAIDASYMYVVGRDSNSDWRIEKRALSNGALDNGFGSSGVVTGASASQQASAIAIDASYMYVAGEDSNSDWRIEKRALSNGALDNGFGSSGVVTGASASQQVEDIAIDASYMYVVGRDSNSDWRIEKRALSNGALDNGFGSSGVVTGASATDSANGVARDSSHLYVVGYDDTSDWRIEKRALSNGALDVAAADVGSALVAQDTSASLTSTGQQFRLRMDLHVNTNKLTSSGLNFKLQTAKKGTGTCASPEFSYADVSSGSGEIRYNSSSNDGIPLTDNANDPAHSGHTNVNQTYEEANNFTNSIAEIPAGQDGLWDFALIDDSAPSNTAYCFRAVKSDGSTLNSYGVYPEITTFDAGGGSATTVDIVDASGDTVASPLFSLASHTLSFACAPITGTFGSSSQRLRISNGFTAENWNLTLAATSGATAIWSDGGSNTYDFNDGDGSPTGCSDGGDSDSQPGQLSVDPSAGTLSPKSGCTATGLTKGSSSSFAEGSTDSLTLLSGDTSTGTDCYWDFTGLGISQKIPPDQPPGTYTINLTLTLTAF